MSSRREEKEQRRAERIAAEEAEAHAAARRRRLGIVAGVVLGLAAVAAVAFALLGNLGGGDPDEPSTPADVPQVPIPPQRTTDLQAAARAAGCRVRSFTPGPNDRQHVEGRVRYDQNPPVFGPHAAVPASDGNYVGQGTPPTEALVHTLEHGRIIIQYKRGLAERRVGQLQTLFFESFAGRPPQFKQVLVENNTNMPFEVAATSWGQQLTCPRFNDQVFDALRAFRIRYVEKAPEGDIPWPQ